MNCSKCPNEINWRNQTGLCRSCAMKLHYRSHDKQESAAQAAERTALQVADSENRHFVNKLRPLFERVALRGGISLEEATKLVVNSAVRP